MGEPLYPCVRPRAGLGVAGYLCLALVGAAALVQPVRAATIQSVQNGSVVLPGGSTFVQVTASQFNPVTLANSFLVFNMRHNQAASANGMVTGQIIGGGATLDFRRTGTSGSVTIEWYVAEFSSGVTVQRGPVHLQPRPRGRRHRCGQPGELLPPG